MHPESLKALVGLVLFPIVLLIVAMWLRNKNEADQAETAVERTGLTGKPKGFSRKNYFLCNLFLPIALLTIALLLGRMSPSPTTDLIGLGFANVAGFLFPIILYAFVVLRYQDIGYRPSWAWALFYFIPFVNLWVVGRCLYQPENHRETKKLDGVGKVVFWAYWLLLVLAIFSIPAIAIFW